MVTSYFDLPKKVQEKLERAYALYGDLMNYLNNLEGLKGEDIRLMIILHATEFYGAVQLASLLLTPECRQVTPGVIESYNLVLEKVIDWLRSGAYYKDGVGLQKMLSEEEADLFATVAICAGELLTYLKEGGSSNDS